MLGGLYRSRTSPLNKEVLLSEEDVLTVSNLLVNLEDCLLAMFKSSLIKPNVGAVSLMRSSYATASRTSFSMTK